jgi:hypothetical protein
MSFTTWSGPIRSENGFYEPVTYVFATDVVASKVNITASGNYVLLSPADGGPASEITLVLPLVAGGDFDLDNQPADEEYNGAKGSVLNYGAVAHVLAGTSSQKVNGSTTGVVIPAGYGVTWGGNGNKAAPWAAVNSVLSTAK